MKNKQLEHQEIEPPTGDMFDNTKKISSLPPVGYHAL